MRFSSYISASALAALASAQTHTECDPTKKDCPNNPAMAANFETNFKAGASGVKGWKQTAGSLDYNGEGAAFTIKKKGDAPTIQSETYLHFGYVEVKMKAAAGQGIVSSIVLQSEDLDEVDWEFLGTTTDKVQMNYFGKGNTTTYDRMIEAPVAAVQQQVHSYALNWTSESLTWIIDNNPVRTLKYGDANGGKNYPQTPCTVRIGIWAGGDPDNEAGVIEWAGGKTDYSKAPFSMNVESVKVTNYSPGKEYKWTDKTGSFQSIEVIGKGDEQGAPQNSAVLTPSASASGGGLQSEVNVPSATTGASQPSGGAPQPSGGAPQPSGGAPHESKSCSESGNVPSSAAPQETPQPSGPAPPSGHNGTAPCSCGVATVTITGPPPVGTPPASPSLPPPVTVSPPPPAPPAQSSGGLKTDTNPAPSVPYPTNPTGALPGGNGTTPSPPPSQFTGAASHNKVGALAGLAAAAMLMV